MELVFLDTEATGLDTAYDRLSQVCYKTSAGIRTEYFKPPVPMSVKAMSITHITNDLLADKPAFSGSAMHQELTALLANGVLVAHNAKFDIAMLAAEGVTVPRHICTLRVARYIDRDGLIPEYNLQYLRYHFGVNVPGGAHDAEADVLVLEAVFAHLLSMLKAAEQCDDIAALQKMIDVSDRPSLFARFTFGKYAGKAVADVARSDPSYLDWLLSQKLASDYQDEDWIYTLEHYLNRT